MGVEESEDEDEGMGREEGGGGWCCSVGCGVEEEDGGCSIEIESVMVVEIRGYLKVSFLSLALSIILLFILYRLLLMKYHNFYFYFFNLIPNINKLLLLYFIFIRKF